MTGENVDENKEGKWSEQWKTLKKALFILIVTLLTIALLFLVYITITKYTQTFTGDLSNDQAIWGVFGDYIGGVLNPVLSFFAFIALLYTIVLQSRELKLTRGEMEKSSLALKEQSYTLKLQNFENTFFKLLEIHLESISNSMLAGNKKGYKCFETIFNSASSSIDANIINGNEISKSFSVGYNSTLLIYKDVTTRFINLHLSLVDSLNDARNKIKNFNTLYYMNIIRRQYDENQIALLFVFYVSWRMDSCIDLLRETMFFSNLNVDLIPEFKSYLEDKFDWDDETIKLRPNLLLDFIQKVYKKSDEATKK